MILSVYSARLILRFLPDRTRSKISLTHYIKIIYVFREKNVEYK
uniref:Uncharacterized protein n=1 Tax=Siphoviridae sp. ctkyH28 TaxID=2827585 RepID=A0A8S5LMZ0_9CAUD|nr:MAG TPA: hypothetical protein [Siphoviridae sp. ctkyH28]